MDAFARHLRKVGRCYPVDALVGVGANAGQGATRLHGAGF
jgi:hypothetical protein